MNKRKCRSDNLVRVESENVDDCIGDKKILLNGWNKDIEGILVHYLLLDELKSAKLFTIWSLIFYVDTIGLLDY